MGADLAGGDAQSLVAEDVACEDVDDAEDDDDDAAGDDDLPEGLPEGFLACRLLVQVAEDRDAENYHHGAEGYKTGLGGEEGPVAGDVAAEDRQFGND